MAHGNSPHLPIGNTTDKDHLNLIAIFHYVVGGFTMLSSGFFVLHFMFMSLMFNHPPMWEQEGQVPPPDLPGGVFMIFIVFYVIGGFTLIFSGLLLIISGRFIHQLKNRTFSIVVAAISCIFFPFGTALGVFTLIKLSSSTVKELYSE